MAEQLKRHIIASKAYYLLCMVCAVFAISIYVALVGGFGAAYATVSSVTLADNDTTGYGLDGRDVRVTWTAGSQPAGFKFTKVLLASSTVNMTMSQAESLFGYMLFDYSLTSINFTEAMGFDSSNQTIVSTSQYVAWVYVSSTSPTLVSSTAVSLTFDYPGDTIAPSVEHMGVHTAITGQKAYIYAFLNDAQTTAAQFHNTGDGGNEYFQMEYSTNTFSTSNTVNAAHIDSGLYVFEIPAANIPAADNTFRYYLRARDASQNKTFFCADWAAATDAACKTGSFIVNVVASPGAPRSISGTVTKGDQTALAGAYVFAGGAALQAVTSSATGTYTLSGLPDNNAYDVTAGGKSGYCKTMNFQNIIGSNKTGVQLTVPQSPCYFASSGGGMGGGASDKPRVMYSSPPEGSPGHPLDKPIVVGFNIAMDSATISSNDPTGVGANVFLAKDDGSKVAGKVFYCSNKTVSAECTDALYTGDTNALVFDPTDNLSASTHYTLEMTDSVRSATGLTVDGNRAGGGHRISFSTFSGAYNENTNPLGSGSAYMPPYVRSLVPGPGVQAKTNTNVVIEFSEPMDTTAVDSSRITLWKIASSGTATQVSASVSLDTSRYFVIIDPSSALSAGEYEVRVKGSVASQEGIAMMPSTQSTQNAFSARFNVESGTDSTAPTLYSDITDGETGVEVNIGQIIFGVSEGLLPTTVNTNNITFKRGSSNVASKVEYDAGLNEIVILPEDVLVPNSQYSVAVGTGVTDIASVALSATQTINFTTGAVDTTGPKIAEARCDDFNCMVRFDEPMNHKTNLDTTNYASSIINTSSISVTVDGGANKATGSSVTLTYDELDNMLIVSGLSGMTIGGTFTVTISNAKDLSGNAIQAGFNTAKGTVENGKHTYGSFQDQGMFGPPTAALGTSGSNTTFSEFKPEGFGSFTVGQVFNGVTEAWPFNRIAGLSSNVFQIKYRPEQKIQHGDIVEVTFPDGTSFSSPATDSNSPFRKDINEFGNGTVTTTVSSSDSNARTVRLDMKVTGTTGDADTYTIDLSGIVNPTIPKGPTTGGYTVKVKLMRYASGVLSTLSTKTSMPYFIDNAGSNSLTVDVTVAGSPASADGDIKFFGGGPAGPMDRTVTLTNGAISAVNSVATTTIRYSNLPDGCYFFFTEPLITLGSIDYEGKFAKEPKCVGTALGFASSGSVSIQYSLPGGGGAQATTTVKITGTNFNGRDVEVFVGGPSRFYSKKFTAVGDLTSGSSSKELLLSENGTWFIGVGPAMEHGEAGSFKMPEPLPGVNPAPMEVVVSGMPGSPSVKAVRTPQNVQFNDTTDTVTFSFASVGGSAVTLTGKVQDRGGTPIAGAEVFVHQQDFGWPSRATTNASGTYSISITNQGTYEIGARKDGLPMYRSVFELRGSSVFFNNVDVTSSGLTITLMKPDRYISGKVLDASDEPVDYVPVIAIDSKGSPTFSQTDANGNYTVYVRDNDTYVLRAELPPSADVCGTYSLTVTLSGSDKTSQNIEPSASECKVLSGTISVNGTGLSNAPVYIEEVTSAGARVIGGERKGTATDSNGAYSVTVSPNKVYRVGFWSPTYGEKSATVTVGSSNATQNITITESNVGFAFTGGTASMSAFIELKNNSDVNKRITKNISGLASAQSLAVESGQTYNYFVDVAGFGKFNGSITAGNTTTLDLSTTNLITVSGTIKDSTGTALSGALVTFSNSSTAVYESALTDSNGRYTCTLRMSSSSADKYVVAASVSGYVPQEAAKQVAFTTTTDNYDFGGSSPDQAALAAASLRIAGNIKDSDGDIMTEGYVIATNQSTGVRVKSTIDGDGTYALPVIAGTWSIEALGPGHRKTTASTNAVVTTASVPIDVTLTAASGSSRNSTSSVGVVAGNTGGTLTSEETGVKVIAGAGVLQTGSGDVTVSMERSYTAPGSELVRPLGDAMFEIEATGNSTITSLNGNMELQIDYDDLASSIPSGVEEGDLILMYYSEERNEYVPVEGGYTVDTTNNVITGQVAHLTGFVVGVPGGESSGSSQSNNNSNNNSNNDSGGGGGGGGGGDAPFGSNPPTVMTGKTAIVINSGSATTDKTDVTLAFNVTGAKTMVISNTNNFETATYIPFEATMPWKLTEGNGKKMVYARFRSAEGGILSASAQVTLVDQATDEAPPAEVACSLTKGNAYKTSKSPAVWYITENCTKRAFVSAQKFFTYFASWNDVKMVDDAALAAISDDTLGFMPWGPLYDPKYGALVKIVADPKVYLLLGNNRHWITSEEVFNGLKYAWNWIEDVDPGLISKYVSSGEITYTDHHPNHTIVKYANSTAVYRLEADPNDPAKQIKRHIKNEQAFNKLGFRWDRIVTIDAAEQYADGPALE